MSDSKQDQSQTIEERERCAKIAEDWISEYRLYTSTGKAIVEKIRNGE